MESIYAWTVCSSMVRLCFGSSTWFLVMWRLARGWIQTWGQLKQYSGVTGRQDGGRGVAYELVLWEKVFSVYIYTRGVTFCTIRFLLYHLCLLLIHNRVRDCLFVLWLIKEYLKSSYIGLSLLRKLSSWCT